LEFENLTLISNKKGLQKVKLTLQKLEKIIPNLTISKPRYGEIRDQILISFRISKDHLPIVIQKLIYNEIKILPTTDEIKTIIENLTNEIATNNSIVSMGWEKAKPKVKKPSLSISQLEEMAEEGNYEEILKISKDMINYGQSLVERAQKVLNQTIFNAIQKNYETGQSNKIKAKESIDNLIKIAGEPILRSTQKTELIKEAGNFAIELSKNYDDLHDELILIANNNKVHNHTNVKAVIAFAELIKFDESENSELIEFAVREINLRWLSIALDVAQTNLTPAELKTFNDFIDFIKTKRAGKADSEN